MQKATESIKESLTMGQVLMEKFSTKWQEVKVAIKGDRQGWQVCLAVLIITIVRSGLTYSFGLFTVTLESTYHASMAEQNWIGTLSFCISLSSSPVSVAFIRMLGHRGYRIGGLVGTVILSVSCLGSSFVNNLEWLFFTHSFLYGIGSSLIYMASSLVIGDHFGKEHKYHVLATSILLCGYPVGSLLFNPIHATLIENYSWRAAFRVTSVLILFTGLICCWNFSSKEAPNMERLDDYDDQDGAGSDVLADEGFPIEESGKPHGKCCTWQDIKRRPEIVLWYLGNLLSYLGFYMPFMNLAYYMVRKGISVAWGSLAITMLSFAECITYIIASFMGDYLKDRLVYVNVAASGALATICLVWPIIDVTYGVILAISLAMGGFLGLNIVYTYAASGEVTQLPIDVAWSFTNLWSGMGILIGPFFSGAIFDIRDKYSDVFLVVGCVYLVDTAVFGAIPLIQRRRERLAEANEDLDGKKYETFRISTKRSTSKSSLANGDADHPITPAPGTGIVTSLPPPYGTITRDPLSATYATSKEPAFSGPSREPAYSGPSREPAYSGPSREPAYSGPSREPAYSGPSREPAYSGPSREPAYSGPSREPAYSGPSREPAVYPPTAREPAFSTETPYSKSAEANWRD